MNISNIIRPLNQKRVDRCYRTAVKVHEITGENTNKLFLEVLYNWFRYGCSDEDFVRFNFYRFNSREKKRWLTSKLNNHYLVHTILDQLAIDTFDNKELFDKTFRDFMKHDFLICSESSETEIRAFINKYGEVIVKPSGGALGIGIYKLKATNEEGILQLLNNIKNQKRFIIEQIIVEHNRTACLNPTSVNTIRVITMIDSKGEVHILNTIAMIGADKGCVSNTHSGGVLCHIDTETGIIDYLGSDVNGNVYLKHPITNIVLPGYQIPNWEGLNGYVKTLAKIVPSARYIGWDIVILEEGYDVIEGNIHPGQGHQATDGKGRWKIIKSLI